MNNYKRFIFILLQTIIPFFLFAQGQIQGNFTVCKESTESYSFSGSISSNCYVSWQIIEGGTFEDGTNNKSSILPTESVKIKWTSNGKLQITNCSGSNFIYNITVKDISLTAAANPNNITAGATVALSIAGATDVQYGWSCIQGDCNLNSTTGNYVTANPTTPSTYNVKATLSLGGDRVCAKNATVSVSIDGTSAPTPSPDFPELSPIRVKPSDEFNISGYEIIYCQNETVRLRCWEDNYNNDCLTFTWQSSTDGINFSDISTGTARDYYIPYYEISHAKYYRCKTKYQYESWHHCSLSSFEKISNVIKIRAFDEEVNLATTYTGQAPVKAYQKVQNVSSTLIKSTADVRVRTEGSIVLNPGFSTEAGADFIAEIGTLCQTNNWRMSNIDENSELEESTANEVPESSISETNKINSNFAYPNPISNGRIHFRQKVNNYSVFNSTGTIVKTGKDADGFIVDDLAKGIYLIKLDDTTTKIVIE